VYNGPRIISTGLNKQFIKNPTPGISDLIVLPKDKPVIFAELKTKTNQSDDQKNFQKMCEDMKHNYVIWRSIDDAIVCLEEIGMRL